MNDAWFKNNRIIIIYQFLWEIYSEMSNRIFDLDNILKKFNTPYFVKKLLKKI